MQQIRTILSRAITLCWRFTDSCSRTSLALGKKIWCNRGLPQSDKDESFFTDRWKIESSRNYPKISELEERFHASIDKSWFDRVTLITSVPDTDVQPCFQHGRVAYAVLSDYLKRADGPVTIFETGTARGLSSLCMVKAMQDQGKFGTVLSFDVLPHFDPIYWNSLGDQGGKRTRSDIFNEVGMDMDGYFVAISSSSKSISEVLNPQRIHFAFLDGEHNFKPVAREFRFISRYQKSGDVILFDDYSIIGVKEVVDSIDPNHYSTEIINIRDQYAMALLVKQ